MKVFIIAEAGVNHNGSLELAKQLVHAAANAGADAVKFQTFQASQLVSKHASKADYQKKTTASDESQLEMIRKLELSAADHEELQNECQNAGIAFMSTPFDFPSLTLLTEKMNLSILKISSGDLTNLPLLYKAGQSGRDIILSSGISTLGEIEEALGALAHAYLSLDEFPSESAFRAAYFSDAGQTVLKQKVSLLHCTTDYPTSYEDVHLNKMLTLRQAFGLKTGYSDHTIGNEVSVAAVALGAQIIEKHFTLDKQMEGPDHLASMDPGELVSLVKQIRNVEQSMGISSKIPAVSELRNAGPARKSIVAAGPIKKGEILQEFHLTLKRPGTGISPAKYWSILGKAAAKDYETDDLIE
ncbi:N-acetylneuraminate synthase [Paenibacillus sp. BIHB 4019]|uniref:N-acetylneuraminate synthase n=1 Tax=Paenibacillus sp. BIHB 4019 TaxID=1870819 RepID=A0A1B2DH28_9BACL|nr:N-acetylneuraminate synthase [Paenibacillus sp. BIHB 4019]ANY66975.1 N-acetylneuraminate synthase [Paenibacillus sp. BIHB 4019]